MLGGSGALALRDGFFGFQDIGAATEITLRQPTAAELLASVPTLELLRRARHGEARARDALYRRYLPTLRRWAERCLPRANRDLNDADDLVQFALLRSLQHLGEFVAAGEGSFLAYLRQILLNQARDEARRARRRPRSEALDVELADAAELSPVERMIDQQRLERYQRALADLPKRQRELVVLRIEFGRSYADIAGEVGGTPDAVRVMIARALVQMARKIGGEEKGAGSA